MQENEFYANCPIRDVLDRFGDKWSLLILMTLEQNDTMRFNEIHKSVCDISQRMLTVTLRTLETDGLISRKIYAEVPPKVEYKLTDVGQSLFPHIQNLVSWAKENTEKILDARQRYGSR